MKNKFYLFLLVLVGIMLLGVGIFIWLFTNSRTEDSTNVTANNNQPTTANTTGSNDQVNATVDTTTTLAPLSKTSEAVALARSFTERYGSFSNQNEFDNINNLRVYMTKNMENQADQIIKNSSQDNADFYGITTKALAVEITHESTERVEVVVSTQRQETKSNESARVFQQPVSVTLLLQNGSWKVEAVTWQ